MAAAAPPAASPAPDLAALLAMIGLGSARQAEPPPPVTPVPRQPTRSREAEDLIRKALQDPMSNERPLFLSADQLDELDIDAEDLAMSLAHLQLHAAEATLLMANCDQSANFIGPFTQPGDADLAVYG
jgi:hypothetical protein